MRSISRKVSVLLGAAALAASAAACSSTGGGPSGEPASGPATSVTSGATYTAAEVAAATGSYKVRPLFAVPKQLPKKYRIILLNNGESNAYFATWHQAMTDAAVSVAASANQSPTRFRGRAASGSRIVSSRRA